MKAVVIILLAVLILLIGGAVFSSFAPVVHAWVERTTQEMEQAGVPATRPTDLVETPERETGGRAKHRQRSLWPNLALWMVVALLCTALVALCCNIGRRPPPALTPIPVGGFVR